MQLRGPIERLGGASARGDVNKAGGQKCKKRNSLQDCEKTLILHAFDNRNKRSLGIFSVLFDLSLSQPLNPFWQRRKKF